MHEKARREWGHPSKVFNTLGAQDIQDIAQSDARSTPYYTAFKNKVDALAM